MKRAAADDASPLLFSGYAALFDVRDAGRNVIRPGAFARSLDDRIRKEKGLFPLFWQHRRDARIGWIEAIVEDERGLAVKGRIDEPTGGAAQALATGKVTGLSIGYRASEFTRTPDGGRELNVIDLIEVSLVTHPLQTDARVDCVSLMPEPVL